MKESRLNCQLSLSLLLESKIEVIVNTILCYVTGNVTECLQFAP